MADPAPAVPPVPSRFTVQQYFALAQNGVLSAEDRVELLGGVVVAMAPHGVTHAASVRLVDYALRAAIGARAVVQCQLSLVQGECSVPEPDVAVLPGGVRDYEAAHPTMALLVVEVADSSLKQDRITKGAIYAEQGLADYWIVNLTAECVEVYRQPRAAERRFGMVTIHRRGERVPLMAFPEVSVAVDDLLPSPRASQ